VWHGLNGDRDSPIRAPVAVNTDLYVSVSLHAGGSSCSACALRLKDLRNRSIIRTRGGAVARHTFATTSFPGCFSEVDKKNNSRWETFDSGRTDIHNELDARAFASSTSYFAITRTIVQLTLHKIDNTGIHVARWAFLTFLLIFYRSIIRTCFYKSPRNMIEYATGKDLLILWN